MLTTLMASVFIFTVSIISLAVSLATLKQRHLYHRLKLAVSQPSSQVSAAEASGANPFIGKLARRMSLPSPIMGSRFTEKLNIKLVKAGIPLKAEEMILFSIIGAFLLAALGSLVYPGLLYVSLFGLVGLVLPWVWVSMAQHRRLARLEAQLLDAVMLMSNSLRGGHSFIQAMELVSRETLPPLSQELGKVVREIRVGVSVEEALNNLVKRVDHKDLEFMVTGVLIQRQVGGNLAAVLDTVADTIEKRIKMRGKIKTLTAQGRMTAWIVSLLPLALGAFVFGKYPEFTRVMLEETAGIAMLAGGLVMLIVGILVIRKVVNIDV